MTTPIHAATPAAGPTATSDPTPAAGPTATAGPTTAAGPAPALDEGGALFSLRGVSKRFATGHLALHDIGLAAAPGSITAILGGSGCGKSTILKLVAGLEAPSAGQITVAGHVVAGPPPEVGLVFQEPRLMPWLTVAQNVAFGLAHLPRAEQAARASAVLERVGLAHAAGWLPRQLSGGMAQRAAIARALVTAPRLLLLDEPFSALDALIRSDLQDHLLSLWDEAPAEAPLTLLLVTHDIEEAVVLADRVLVMAADPGRIVADHAITLPRAGRRDHPGFMAERRHLLGLLQAARDPAAA